MLFWISVSLLTVCAVLSVLLPIARRSSAAERPQSHDLEVYRDQLSELDRDAARGLIGAAEADEARAEISRRILKAAGEGKSPSAGGRQPGLAAGRAVALAAVLSVPLVSWSLYGLLGSPDLPSQPLSARLAADPAQLPADELVARAEAHLVAFPDDGRGWDVLAPVYLRMGRYQDAVVAFRKAIQLAGATANREAGLGEALAAAAGGMITADARDAFAQALQLEPGHPKSQFFLAGALAQQGRLGDAIAAWTVMRSALAVGSPWLPVVDQALAEAGRQTTAVATGPAQPGTGPAQPGPSADDVAAASQMSADDRNAMIETMVARLDEKLKLNPHDAEGWQRLVRSYQVLGKTEAARDALSRGVAALGAETDAAAGLQALAASLGLARAQ